MDKFISPGMFGGNLFNKGTNPDRIGVTDGPNTEVIGKSPIDVLIDKTHGSSESFYEPNGAVLDNIPIEYLKS
jgi:hypothetical protein